MSTFKYFDQSVLDVIKRATSFGELLDIALQVIEKMNGRIVGICSPISTKRNERDNFSVFNETNIAFEKAGVLVFNEIPFQEKIVELKNKWFAEHPEKMYCDPLITDFYKPILKTGKIVKLFTLPEYEHPYVPYWEDLEAHLLHIPTVLFPLGWEQHYDVTKIQGLEIPQAKQ